MPKVLTVFIVLFSSSAWSQSPFTAMPRNPDLLELGQATVDVVSRALLIDQGSGDPYAVVPKLGPRAYSAKLCTTHTLKEGLQSGSCNAMLLEKECGPSCLWWRVDDEVFAEHKDLIVQGLTSPCVSLDTVRLPEGYKDVHPRSFFMTYGRTVWILGCHREPKRGAVSIEREGDFLAVTYGELK